MLKKSLIVFTLISFIFLSVLSGCKNEKKSQTASFTVQNQADGIPLKMRSLSTETKDYLDGKNILIVLGYGYNDDSQIESITKTLEENFGVESEDNPALISLFIYPRDFIVAGKERISSLADRIEDKNLAGMIILGAPEGMHIALSKIQDKNENGVIPYPVFTFFSQDDVLGTESTSDFVLDYAHKTNTIEGEVTDFIPDFDVSKILVNSVTAMMELREPIKADASLSTFVKNLLEQDRTLVHYVDGETGLQSINHFVFE